MHNEHMYIYYEYNNLYNDFLVSDFRKCRLHIVKHKKVKHINKRVNGQEKKKKSIFFSAMPMQYILTFCMIFKQFLLRCWQFIITLLENQAKIFGILVGKQGIV